MSQISNLTKMLAGIILIAVPTIELGGAILLHLLRRRDPAYVDNPLRQDLFRAGHAHAGVLVILSLICLFLADGIILPAPLAWFVRLAAPMAAILMPLGFFLSVASPAAKQPNGRIGLVYLGAIILALGMLILGLGLVLAAGPIGLPS